MDATQITGECYLVEVAADEGDSSSTYHLTLELANEQGIIERKIEPVVFSRHMGSGERVFHISDAQNLTPREQAIMRALQVAGIMLPPGDNTLKSGIKLLSKDELDSVSSDYFAEVLRKKPDPEFDTWLEQVRDMTHLDRFYSLLLQSGQGKRAKKVKERIEQMREAGATAQAEAQAKLDAEEKKRKDAAAAQAAAQEAERKRQEEQQQQQQGNDNTPPPGGDDYDLQEVVGQIREAPDAYQTPDGEWSRELFAKNAVGRELTDEEFQAIVAELAG